MTPLGYGRCAKCRSLYRTATGYVVTLSVSVAKENKSVKTISHVLRVCPTCGADTNKIIEWALHELRTL